MATEASSKYIPTLDGWRALAILGVMTCHASDYFFGNKGYFPNPRFKAYLAQGAVGVDIFFVLSGFLICSGLVREDESYGRISLRGFYTRRIFRILPPYFSYLLTIILLGQFGLVAVSRLEVTACLLFFRNFVRGLGWYTTHFWTLALEEQFYLLFPGFLVLAGRKKATSWTLGLLLLTTGFRLFNSNGRWLGSIFTNPTFNPEGEDRINELILGALLALTLRSATTRDLLRKVPPFVCLLLIALVVYGTAHPLPLQPLTFPLLLGVLVILTSLTPHSMLGRALEHPSLRWIGRMSYSLYLWQELFLVLGTAPAALPLGFLQRWPTAPFALFGCALLSYHLIEKPCISVGRQLSAAIVDRTTSVKQPSL